MITKSDAAQANPLPKKAWALVRYGADAHLLEFANGFGIYPTRTEAESCARDYHGAYTVIRVEICAVTHPPRAARNTP